MDELGREQLTPGPGQNEAERGKGEWPTAPEPGQVGER